jgi:UDP-glucose 4-epimerase
MSCVVGVTGGSGFIGKVVMDELSQRGHNGIVIDRAEGIDIRDKDAVWSIVKKCNHIIHLAGVLGTEELFDSPHDAVDININGALNILLGCREYGASYTAIQMPFTGWTNIYQSTKLCAMNLAQAYHKYFGVKISFVRAYNAFGKGQKVHGVRKIIPTFSTAAWRNLPIPIWGSGNQIVDLVHVNDIARMLVDAIKFGNGETFDAGTGQAFTVQNVANMVIDCTRSTQGALFQDMRKGEVEDGIPPVAKGDGWDLLGWIPEFRVDDLNEVIAWYKEDRK